MGLWVTVLALGPVDRFKRFKAQELRVHTQAGECTELPLAVLHYPPLFAHQRQNCLLMIIKPTEQTGWSNEGKIKQKRVSVPIVNVGCQLKIIFTCQDTCQGPRLYKHGDIEAAAPLHPYNSYNSSVLCIITDTASRAQACGNSPKLAESTCYYY